MNDTLRCYVDQFVSVYGRKPEAIVVTPMALLALALKGLMTRKFDGIPVEVRLFRSDEVIKPGRPGATRLGIFVKKMSAVNLGLVAVNLGGDSEVTTAQLPVLAASR